MAEPFKNLIHPGLVKLAAEHLGKHCRAFDQRGFLSVALTGLETLEMKARAMQIATALEQSLPREFSAAAQAIEAALTPPFETEELGRMQPGSQGLCGWIVWPLGEFVARRGLVTPERALQCLHALTQRFSAEFAIRPFLIQHQDLTLRLLKRWTKDQSLHVRRLCSEGSRPRLPWGLQLPALIKDPSPTEPILLALQDDPSAYVRRSVANHLNDIAKDHPGRVVAWVERHLPGASDERRALLSHASRTLIKAGHKPLLRAFGLNPGFLGQAELSLGKRRVAVGESLPFQLTLHSTARKAQNLVVDFAVHYQKSDGSQRPKVFKGWKLELAAGTSVELTKQASFKPVTTRRLYAGDHALEILVNGASVARADFTLSAAPSSQQSKPKPLNPTAAHSGKRSKMAK
jgi:3-methyladenine DNA glycosylase AlkC